MSISLSPSFEGDVEGAAATRMVVQRRNASSSAPVAIAAVLLIVSLSAANHHYYMALVYCTRRCKSPLYRLALQITITTWLALLALIVSAAHQHYYMLDVMHEVSCQGVRWLNTIGGTLHATSNSEDNKLNEQKHSPIVAQRWPSNL